MKFTSNLLNWLKSKAYLKEEVDSIETNLNSKIQEKYNLLLQAIESITSFEYSVVNTLPDTGEDGVIYLVPKNYPEDSNIYNQYLYVNSTWEKVGDTEIDLTDYVTSEELTNALLSKAGLDVATEDKNGLMSKSDKSKLDGIADSADSVSFTRSLASGTKMGTITINGVSTDLYCNNDTNTTYDVVTTSANGLMSKSDKSKLDGVANGATAVTVDSSLSSTSHNPVQNRVINTALNSKADANHTHAPVLTTNAPTPNVTCYKQNGWVLVSIITPPISKTGEWVTLCTLPWANSTGQDIYGIISNGWYVARVRIDGNNILSIYLYDSSITVAGQIMYPTSE